MNKNNRPAEKDKRPLIITVLVILLLVLVIVILDKDLSPTAGFWQILFSRGESRGETVLVGDGMITDIEKDSSELNEYYKNFDSTVLLKETNEAEVYNRTLRVMIRRDDKLISEKVTINKNGQKYRITTPSKTVICDGNRVRIITPYSDKTLPNVGFTIYDEAGIESISSLASKLENYTIDYTLNRAENTVEFTVGGEVVGVTTDYIVSIESGIVLSEISYVNDQIYRAVVTDSIEILSQEEADGKLFTTEN